MANKIHDYPKSLCSCYMCTDNHQHHNKSGNPSNMSIRKCEFPLMDDCYNNTLFRSDIEPQLKKGYTNINPQVITNNYADNFKQLPENFVKTNYLSTCSNPQYISNDPRLFSPLHGNQTLTLDRPPLDGTVKLANIYTDKSLDYYGQGYQTYSDINAGQIVYYNNHEQEDPLFFPNFTKSAYVHGKLYRDPMGSLKPEYYRKPITYTNHLNTKNQFYDELSFIKDSTEQREDLMARQMAIRFQQRWEPRWYGYTANNEHKRGESDKEK